MFCVTSAYLELGHDVAVPADLFLAEERRDLEVGVQVVEVDFVARLQVPEAELVCVSRLYL